MSKLIQYREQMAASLLRVKDLHGLDQRSDDQERELDRLLAEVNDLGPKIIREQQIEDASKRHADFEAPATRSAAGIVPNGEQGKPQERGEATKIDRRSLSQRFVESPSFTQYQGRGKGVPFAVRSFYHRDAAETAITEGMTPQEVRALVYTGALPASFIQPQVLPGIYRGDDLQGSVRDVLLNGQTQTDAITFFRELVFTNNAAAVAEAVSSVTGLKPESGITFEEETATVKTIAHWIPITRQTLDDASQMRTYIEGRLLDGLRLAESDQLLNGDGTGANLTGLLQTSGIQALDGAYFTGAPVADAGQANENFNRILRARRLIRTTGRARANFVVINPADSEEMLTYTDANRGYYGPGPFSGSSVVNLWGMRVVEDENIAAGTVLVGDGRMAAVWDRMQAQILIDTIDDQFVRNMLTILAEERLALTVFRPAAFAEVTLA